MRILRGQDARASVITADRERDFYDRHYASLLTLPDHALRIDREILESAIEDPCGPLYERRLLYRASMRALEAAQVRGKKVLDYGCGPADFGLWMATEGADVTLLDLSPAAIELALRRAQASGVAVRGIAADASELRMLRDREFDVVFACASLHHTLKYPGAVEELGRIMKPGALLILCETWGGNPLLNAARRLRAFIAREQEEQGEDIIMAERELKLLEPLFANLTVNRLNLFAMGKRLVRGRFERSWARRLVRVLESIDTVVLSIAPSLRNWCGEAVITGQRRN
jgi:2-polyprenyl-3-methyl-5-hydroxy-6-metoxy-1,4-benzoquinol methylase